MIEDLVRLIQVGVITINDIKDEIIKADVQAKLTSQ